MVLRMSNNDRIDFWESPLERLLAEVLASPPHSKARAKNLSRLIQFLQHLPEIKKVNHQDYSLALNQTWVWFSREVDKFKRSDTGSLENDLVKWINGYLKWRIYDLYFPQKSHPQEHSLDATIPDSDTTYLDLLSEEGFIETSLGSLDKYIENIQQLETQKLGREMEAWIADDPEDELKQCFPKNYPDCNCQILSEKLLLQDPPDSLTRIAQEAQIPYQTLVAHWKRSCLKLLQNKAKSLDSDN